MPKLIYVADDEKNICFLIENFLEKEGYEVECFGDGESLLDAFQKKEPCSDHHCLREGFPIRPDHRNHSRK